MCFSAPASFTASGVLFVIGTIVLSKVKNKRLIPLALLPYLFAIQQAFEGILWLQLTSDPYSTLALVSKNVFLSFAFVVWPIWVPMSLLIPEVVNKRKILLILCLFIGIAVAIFLGIRIPYTTGIPYCGSIHYVDAFRDISVNRPWAMIVLIVIFYSCYAIATILPMFISSLKRIWMLGVFVAIAAVLTYTLDHIAFVSMWCFFAAIVSISLIFIIKKEN